MPTYLPTTLEHDRAIPDPAPFSQGMDETAAEAAEALSVAYAQDILTISAVAAAGRVVNLTSTFDGAAATVAGRVTINWGDGTESVAAANPAPHTYPVVGNYAVSMRFTRPGLPTLERTALVTAIT